MDEKGKRRNNLAIPTSLPLAGQKLTVWPEGGAKGKFTVIQ